MRSDENPHTTNLISCCFIMECKLLKGSGLKKSSFQITRVPEGPGRFPEGLPEALFGSFQFRCSSGRFRKVSGRLTGRLFQVVVWPESRKGSGRFPEDMPEGFRKAGKNVGQRK